RILASFPLKPGSTRLDGFFKIIGAFYFYFSAKDLVVAGDVQHIELRSAKAEIRHLALGSRNGDNGVDSSELIQNLNAAKGGNIDPSIPVAFQTVTPGIFVHVANVKPSVLLFVCQRTVRLNLVDPHPMAGRFGNV